MNKSRHVTNGDVLVLKIHDRQLYVCVGEWNDQLIGGDDAWRNL